MTVRAGILDDILFRADFRGGGGDRGGTVCRCTIRRKCAAAHGDEHSNRQQGCEDPLLDFFHVDTSFISTC